MSGTINIIKELIITEKTSFESSHRNAYTFKVGNNASKKQIAGAISAMFNVKVTRVNTTIQPGGTKVTRFGRKSYGSWKKAIVTLESGQSIEIN